MFRLALIAVCLSGIAAHSLSLAEVASRLALSSLPEVVDYTVTTTAHLGPSILVSKTHIIQAGPLLQRVEFEAGGKRLRMIRNGSRTQIVDLATGSSQVVPTAHEPDQLAMVRSPLAGGHWLEPVALGEGLWEIRDTTSDGVSGSQSFRFSEKIGQVVGLSRVSTRGDTTHMIIHWASKDDRMVLQELDVTSKVEGQTSHMRIVYSGWLFPRSIPPDLFAIP